MTHITNKSKTNLNATVSNPLQRTLAISLFLGTFLLLSLSLSAQPGIIQWEGNYGGYAAQRARSVQQTDDGGYIVAGLSFDSGDDVSDNNGFSDYWLVKLDASGTIQWEGNYGGSSGDEAKSVQQTDDGGYIVAGYSRSDDFDVSGNNGTGSIPSSDYWLVKLDASGTIQWEGNYGGSDWDKARSVQQTDDGGYIVAGKSGSDDGDVSGNNGDADSWILKLDGSGTIQWEGNYGGTTDDIANSVQQTDDGGYIVAGYSIMPNYGSIQDLSYWVVKLDASGTILWESKYGGDQDDVATSVQQADDGGYIVAGRSESDNINGDVSGNNGDVDYWVVKLDGAGTIQWENNYGGSYGDKAWSVQQTNDGGYIVAGETASDDGDISGNNGSNNYWFVKLDSSGSIQWERNYGGSSIDIAYSVQQTDDGGYIVAGYSQSDDGDVSGNNGQDDFWVVKLNGSGTTGISSNSFERKIKFYPNPAREKVMVELPESVESLNATVLDATGRKISEKSIENTNRFQLEIGESAGIYFLELEYADGRKTVRKVMKE